MREEEELLGIIKVDAFKCEKCGHIWISRMYTKDDPPVTCAKCKNPYWNRPKVSKK
jgi:hypothetical protein